MAPFFPFGVPLDVGAWSFFLVYLRRAGSIPSIADPGQVCFSSFSGPAGPELSSIWRTIVMKMNVEGNTVRVSGVKELGAANANQVRDEVKAVMSKGQKNIDFDLSETTFVDSCGLGALISIHKTACSHQGALRLLHPLPPVQQILELTRMHRIFEIVKP
jgi:anti-sigma B factor antagonist